MQVGGALGIAIIGTMLQRREFFHYVRYMEEINNTFSIPVSGALAVMQELLLRAGYSPAEIAEKGKSLLTLWVQKQAAVSSFGDVFLMAGVFITVGILPTLLIRNTRFSSKEETIGLSQH